MDEFEFLYGILKDLQKHGLLDKVILIGSWCQYFYRHQYNQPKEIPATRTKDADFLIPKRLHLAKNIDLAALLRGHDLEEFHNRETKVTKFKHPSLDIEFLTDPGPKSDETGYYFKNLNIVAQELHFMSIPLRYNQIIKYKELTLRLPEPEAFALHKLIISQRRLNPDKKVKDIKTAQGMFAFFEGKGNHIKRLHEIINDMSKSWRKKVEQALKECDIEFVLQKK